MRTGLFTLSLLITTLGYSYAHPIQQLEIAIDSNRLTWPQDGLMLNGVNTLILPYFYKNNICQLRIWTNEKDYKPELLPSSDYEILDTMVRIEDYYRFKIRLQDLTVKDFLKFSFITQQDTQQTVHDIPIQPVTETRISMYVRDDELFIGEEKVFEILCNNTDNLVLSNEWKHTEQIDYRIRLQEGKVYLHLVPNKLGSVNLDIPLAVRKPQFTKGRLNYLTNPLQQKFYVKSSRLQFLNLTPKELTLNEQNKRDGIEVQLNYNRLLKMNKTYRIEDQEEAGGPLIAELFTKQRLANNKVLCLLRPYNYHHKSEGYLYIKDGDHARFISNFSVTHATTIDRISVLREGGEWKPGRILYPGETVELKLEGKSLHKANFRFEDLIDLTQDTVARNNTEAIFKLKIPLNIAKRTITIYNNNQPSGHTLRISEYQRPREFDYLYLSYGTLGRKVSAIRGPILHNKIVKDVVISLNPQTIDSKEKIYGKQYIDIDLRITGKRNELIEMRSIEGIAICPGDRSPRHDKYKINDCRTEDISLNKYLSRKTYDLDEWSKISMTFKHDKDKYGGEGFQKEVDIILKRTFSFDIDVSFPAGLITISKDTATGKTDFSSLSGISMAMIAQFSFYHPEKIAQYRPYKIGAGFLALNAFNFSENASGRDVGIVILGSIYPTKRDHKLSFPLYMGGGYFVKEQKWFFLIGPGIRVRL